MRKLLATLTILFLFATPIIVEAANCPAEVQAAKDMLKKQSAQADQIQTPRALAGAVSREANAPRSGGESAAPRTDKREANAPRVDRESNAPRGQDSAAPRTAASAPQVSKARTLVNEAETACKAGDMTKATQKAKAAMDLLK